MKLHRNILHKYNIMEFSVTKKEIFEQGRDKLEKQKSLKFVRIICDRMPPKSFQIEKAGRGGWEWTSSTSWSLKTILWTNRSSQICIQRVVHNVWGT